MEIAFFVFGVVSLLITGLLIIASRKLIRKNRWIVGSIVTIISVFWFVGTVGVLIFWDEIIYELTVKADGPTLAYPADFGV